MQLSCVSHDNEFYHWSPKKHDCNYQSSRIKAMDQLMLMHTCHIEIEDLPSKLLFSCNYFSILETVLLLPQILCINQQYQQQSHSPPSQPTNLATINTLRLTCLKENIKCSIHLFAGHKNPSYQKKIQSLASKTMMMRHW